MLRNAMNIMLRNILAMIHSIVSIIFSAGILAETTTQHCHPQNKMSFKYTVPGRILLFSAILALTGLFCTPQLDAEIYQWVDEKGVKHYSNMPPADAENAKIVSGEYKHDEAADQKRVKFDQKKMDALTEKIKKGEQQASVEEQKKSEEAKQTQPPSQEKSIESEKQHLQKKITELEAQTLDYFGSQKNKRTTIGYYKYRLETLLQDPDKYFSEPDNLAPRLKIPRPIPLVI
jgi:hypothetical protein